MDVALPNRYTNISTKLFYLEYLIFYDHLNKKCTDSCDFTLHFISIYTHASHLHGYTLY